VDKLDCGRIVLLREVVDPQGKLVGEHFGIVQTTKAELQAGYPIRVAVISSKLHYTTNCSMVKLPYLNQKGGHPQTSFTKPSAVICCWVVDVSADDILEYGRIVWGQLLQDIAACVSRAAEAKAKKTNH